jgi:hypothetical protein
MNSEQLLHLLGTILFYGVVFILVHAFSKKWWLAALVTIGLFCALISQHSQQRPAFQPLPKPSPILQR